MRRPHLPINEAEETDRRIKEPVVARQVREACSLVFPRNPKQRVHVLADLKTRVAVGALQVFGVDRVFRTILELAAFQVSQKTVPGAAHDDPNPPGLQVTARGCPGRTLQQGLDQRGLDGLVRKGTD